MKFKNILKNAKQWYFGTAERALDRAYKAALVVKAIEDEYFQGKQVCREENKYNDRVFSYCESEVKKNLKIAKIRLAEFKMSTAMIEDESKGSFDYLDTEIKDKSALIIEKLEFIDGVIAKYETPPPNPKIAVSLVKVPQEKNGTSGTSVIKTDSPKNKSLNSWGPRDTAINARLESASSKTGAVPRSILNTFSRIRREIDPQGEESEGDMILKFRQSRNRTNLSIRFLLFLIILPLLVHQLTKTFIFLPIIEHQFFNDRTEVIFLNQDLEEEAMSELNHFEESLHFKQILGFESELSEEKIEMQVKEKAKELEELFRKKGAAAISNVFADLCSIVAFAWVIFVSKSEITIIKDFLDETVYGLSDSAKAFLIILFTDIFVGFHSPHGWEILLEGVARHFGIPENREFSFLFIATFPVILDTVLKYWIFRYLNRISPSAVATYKTMNE